MGIRDAIEEHWRASEAGETAAEHAMYAKDAARAALAEPIE